MLSQFGFNVKVIFKHLLNAGLLQQQQQ